MRLKAVNSHEPPIITPDEIDSINAKYRLYAVHFRWITSSTDQAEPTNDEATNGEVPSEIPIVYDTNGKSIKNGGLSQSQDGPVGGYPATPVDCDLSLKCDRNSFQY
jgi:hypothetical protein